MASDIPCQCDPVTVNGGSFRFWAVIGRRYLANDVQDLRLRPRNDS